MSGYVDLHCHFVAQIDDGCRTFAESAELLRGLASLGFEHVVATPHMRPGLFDNNAASLRQAYARTVSELNESERGLPTLSLASEHFFDAQVIDAIHLGQGLPYAAEDGPDEMRLRTGGGILIEFLDLTPLSVIEQQLFRLLSHGFLPVIAHPERYRQVWKDPHLVERLQDAGSVALLDSAALVGKYGGKAQDCARHLLAEGVYVAACSDAHRPSDVRYVEEAMNWIQREYGREELALLFSHGPQQLLQGKRPDSL